MGILAVDATEETFASHNIRFGDGYLIFTGRIFTNASITR